MIRAFAAAVICAPLLFCSCKSSLDRQPEGRLVFEDRFDRKEPGADWLDTGGAYRIENGALRAKGARNRPLWLKRKLPRDARIEFRALSKSPAVDIKAELWGDGKSKATSVSYSATSYVIILGGWNNSLSAIARMNEHGKDRVIKKRPRPTDNRWYSFAIVRQGGLVSWFLDRDLFMRMDDPQPLEGDGHEYFAFNNWESEVLFDDLLIYAL